ncbi:MAG: transposase [Phycisphaerales bacterium]|nr:transposase [Phycisphaerales bacterium]
MGRKVYSDEFKRAAIEQVIVQRHTVSSVAQPFYFLRDTQILLSITKTHLGFPPVTAYNFYASVGGSQVSRRVRGRLAI